MLDSYLFQLIVLLKPDFNCCSNFSIISNFSSPVELVITQSLDHNKRRLTSQLINSISIVLRKVLKYFNGTIISTSFVFPLAGIFAVISILDLNDSVKLLSGSSL